MSKAKEKQKAMSYLIKLGEREEAEIRLRSPPLALLCALFFSSQSNLPTDQALIAIFDVHSTIAVGSPLEEIRGFHSSSLDVIYSLVTLSVGNHHPSECEIAVSISTEERFIGSVLAHLHIRSAEYPTALGNSC